MKFFSGVVGAIGLYLLAGSPLFAEPRAKAGHLVMIGGGLSSSNEVVYNKMIDLAGEDGAIGIIPAAASDWERSTRSVMGRFESYGAGERTDIIEVHRNDLEAALLPEIADQISEKRLLFFTGGQQHRILTAFRPRNKEEAIPAYKALWDVLADGGVIAGSSAGAAMMSDPQIRGGNSAGALDVYLKGGEGRGVRTERGMGFFPFGMTDQHFSERGRFARLVVALDREEVTRGFGISENRALHVDLGAETITGIGGHQTAIIVDMSEAVYNGHMFDNIRVSMIGDGDVVDGNTGGITPRGDLEPVNTRELTRKVLRSDTLTEPYYTSDDPWGSKVVAHALGALTRSEYPVITIGNENFEVVFTHDDRTRMYIAAGHHDKSLEDLDFVLINALAQIIAVPSEDEEKDYAKDSEPIIIKPEEEEEVPAF